MNKNRIVIVVNGGVAYTIKDDNVEVLIIDLDNDPNPNTEEYEGFEDLIPPDLKEN